MMNYFMPTLTPTDPGYDAKKSTTADPYKSDSVPETKASLPQADDGLTVPDEFIETSQETVGE